MKLPRDLDAEKLIILLGRHGYIQTRQTGSHVRLTRDSDKGQHHITIPRHGSLKVGTLNRILADVADHLGIPKDEMFRR